jgi:hypothetical protein
MRREVRFVGNIRLLSTVNFLKIRSLRLSALCNEEFISPQSRMSYISSFFVWPHSIDPSCLCIHNLPKSQIDYILFKGKTLNLQPSVSIMPFDAINPSDHTLIKNYFNTTRPSSFYTNNSRYLNYILHTRIRLIDWLVFNVPY